MVAMQRELIIDGFAGGGGASSGIERALGISPDIAINHNKHALACHQENHPRTRHVEEDVWKAKLRKLVNGRPVGLLWISPDCKHFSRAKGSVPVSKEIRSLAWVAVRWASQVKPRVIILENVREFSDWGPVVPRWICRKCEWSGTEGQVLLQRSSRRCPRCGSLKVRQERVSDSVPSFEIWRVKNPKGTQIEYKKLKSNHTSVIIPDPQKKAMTFRLFCNRLRGLGYQVQWKNLDAADFGAPSHRRRLFLIARCDSHPIVWPEVTHADPKKIAATPLFGRLKSWRTAAECINFDLPCPSIFDRKKPLADKTLRRIGMGIKQYVLESAEPFIIPVTHVCEGQTPRTLSLDKPLGTVVAGGAKHALVYAFLVKHFGGVVGGPIDTPLPTVTTRGTQNQIAACNLVRFNHGHKQWHGVNEPLGTVTSQGIKFGLVYAFLVKYFGTAIGQPLTDPLHTITVKHRFGLVQVEFQPGMSEPAVALDVPGKGTFVIADIGMRMLKPRELALAQGFAPNYKLPLTITRAVSMIGNSVCPPIAEAIVKENFTPAKIRSCVGAN